MYCQLHHKLYFKDAYEEHIKSHKKCQICGMEFKKQKNLSLHMNKAHLNNNQIIINNQNKKEDLMKNNLNQDMHSDKIKCTECDKIFGSVESMSAHYYDIHEKKLNLNVQSKNNKEVNQKENIFKVSKENKIHEKLMLSEELKEKEKKDFKRKEELRKLKEIKKQEELKKEEERKKQEELRKLEELKKQEELRKIEEEEKKRKKLLDEIKIEKNHKQEKFKIENNYYECYHDKKIFKTEKEYVSHFNKYHEYDFPFYCETCDKGFYSQKINYCSF